MGRRRKHPRKQRELSLRNHANMRCSERYGVHLTNELHDTLVKAIQGGKATLQSRRSLRVAAYTVRLNGVAYNVVYDRNRKMLVTFLPKDRWEREESSVPEPVATPPSKLRMTLEERLEVASQHTPDDVGCCSLCEGFVAYPCRTVQTAERLAQEAGFDSSSTG